MGVPILVFMVVMLIGVLLWPALKARAERDRRLHDPLDELRRQDEATIAKLADHPRRRGNKPKNKDPQP
jgi:hypothetical protein